MTKKDIRDILVEMEQHQMHANLGGIVGDKDDEKDAEDDLNRFINAVKWFDKNVMTRKTIK